MTFRALAAFVVSFLALPSTLVAQERDSLVPAGAINATFQFRKIVVLSEDEPAVLKFAERVRDRAFADARILTGADAAGADLRGHNVIVFGSLSGHPWLAKHEARLPFRLGSDRVGILDREFAGKHLRVICTMRNPQDPARQVLIYTASRSADVVGITGVFHGPTQWVVADGGRALGSGSFHRVGLMSAQEMTQDLDFLAAKIARVHPAAVEGLPAETRAVLESTRKRIATPMTAREFWFAANAVLLTLHDAHTSMTALGSGAQVDLPLDWLDEGLIVSREARSLRRGDRVLDLGGRTVDQLLAGLRQLIPAENDYWVRIRGVHMLTDVAVLARLGAVADAGQPVVRITVERAGAKSTHELRVGEVTPHTPERQPWARWRLLEEDSLGVFVLDQCRNDDFYKGKVREFFTAVHDKKIRRVAVDVRRNSGGNSSVTDEFLRYVDVGSYKSFTGAVRTSEESKEQRGGGELGYRRFGPNVVKNRRSESPPPFTGELFVLTSNYTFSSGTWFAVVVHDNGLGKVLGEASGNAPSSYGDILAFTLPVSGFTFDMSFKQWIRPDPDRDPANSLPPDVPIVRSRADLISGRDPVLEYLRKR